MEKRTERAIQVVAGTALAIGCLMVLKPFLAALLSAAILCFSTWPLYRLIERRLGGRDRKSTRLNSSHPSISYAVFCLKKKHNCAYSTFCVIHKLPPKLIPRSPANT